MFKLNNVFEYTETLIIAILTYLISLLHITYILFNLKFLLE